MKTIITLILIMTFPVFASGIRLTSIKQVIWLKNSDEDSGMLIRSVPFVTAGADPEWRFSAISSPFIPPSDSSWHRPSDINLASLYGIVVTGTYKKNSKDVEAIIDLSNAKVPEGYPYTLEQVTKQVEECVRLMYPNNPKIDSKLEIKVIKSIK